MPTAKATFVVIEIINVSLIPLVVEAVVPLWTGHIFFRQKALEIATYPPITLTCDAYSLPLQNAIISHSVASPICPQPSVNFTVADIHKTYAHGFNVLRSKS